MKTRILLLAIILSITSVVTAQQRITNDILKQGENAVIKSPQYKHLSDSLKAENHYCKLYYPSDHDTTGKPLYTNILDYNIEVYGPPIHCDAKCVYTFTYSIKHRKVIRFGKTWEDEYYAHP